VKNKIKIPHRLLKAHRMSYLPLEYNSGMKFIHSIVQLIFILLFCVASTIHTKTRTGTEYYETHQKPRFSISQLFGLLFIQQLFLIFFISFVYKTLKAGESVDSLGDDVSIPALGQSNFLRTFISDFYSSLASYKLFEFTFTLSRVGVL